jgi:hypothetical protein
MQIQLNFMEELPESKKSVWNQLDDERRAATVEAIARFMVKAISGENNEEKKND